MNARVFFAAVLGIGLYIAVFYFAPNDLIRGDRFKLSILVLLEVTAVCVLLRLYGAVIMRSRWGTRGWRLIFTVHSTAYALTWGLACAYMIEALKMDAYSISVTTTALAACTVAVSTFSFDLVACALFLGSLLLPLLKASLFSVENGQGLAGACTLSISFFLYLAYSLHKAEVDGVLNAETIVTQAEALRLSNDLFRGTIDSIDEIFLTVGLDGVCYGNLSDRATRVLGVEPIGRHVGEILDPKDRETLQSWFTFLESGRFEFENIVDLVPKQWTDETNQLTYRIGWFPMRSDGRLKSVIMTLTDITARLRNQEQARLAAESARMTLAISADPAVFARFMGRVRAVLEPLPAWSGETITAVQKDLHDLKGFAGVFGFTSFVGEISRIEARLKSGEDDAATLVRAAGTELSAWFGRWAAAEDSRLRRLRVFAPPELTVPLPRVQAVRAKLVATPDQADLFDQLMTDLSAPNLARVVGRFEEALTHVAGRLGKRVELVIDPSCADIYLGVPAWVHVVESMIHLMNNAVDHGLETPDVRRQAGKTEGGLIRVSAQAYRDDGGLKITVDDDGRGLDIVKLRERLRQRGIDPAALSDHDVAQSIFTAGVSTKDIATDISGQGVGLFGLMEDVRRTGGQLTVGPSPLGGARFVISLAASGPARAAA